MFDFIYKKYFLEFQRDASAELTSKDESHLKVSFSVFLLCLLAVFLPTFYYLRLFCLRTEEQKEKPIVKGTWLSRRRIDTLLVGLIFLDFFIFKSKNGYIRTLFFKFWGVKLSIT